MNVQRRQPRAQDAMTLPMILKELGAPKERNRHGNLHYRIFRRPWWELKDLYDFAKAEWKRRLARCHPDRGGSHEEAARLNQLWAQAEKRFAKYGIPT